MGTTLEPERARRARGTQTQSASRDKPTVLLVDDEALMRTVMKRVLLDEGFEVLTAASAEEALAIAGRDGAEIDLVLTDLLMPGMGGLEMATLLRRSSPDVPFIFMSGAPEVSSIRRPSGLAGELVLEKPFEIETLARCVRDTLAARSTTWRT